MCPCSDFFVPSFRLLCGFVGARSGFVLVLSFLFLCPRSGLRVQGTSVKATLLKTVRRAPLLRNAEI